MWLRAGADEAKSRLVRVERDGRVSPPAGAGLTSCRRRGCRPMAGGSPSSCRSGVMTRDIRVLDAAQPERVTLTIEGGDNQSPAWMRQPPSHVRIEPRRLAEDLRRRQSTAERPPAPLFTADADCGAQSCELVAACAERRQASPAAVAL